MMFVRFPGVTFFFNFSIHQVHYVCTWLPKKKKNNSFSQDKFCRAPAVRLLVGFLGLRTPEGHRKPRVRDSEGFLPDFI
jgi:hypothetical protein